jgi:5-methylcytosine-specific restriction endonuclease McrA
LVRWAGAVSAGSIGTLICPADGYPYNQYAMSAVDANVLVLNLDFQPLNVCNVRRAIVLLSKEKAEVIEQNGHLIISARQQFPSPSVIRLAYHIKRPRPVVKLTRKEVLVRDDHSCQYCGKRAHDLTIDHVLPRHRGGQHVWENVVAACKPCNHRKGGKTLHEAHMHLIRAPFRPPSTPHYLFSSYLKTELAWHKFLGIQTIARPS